MLSSDFRIPFHPSGSSVITVLLRYHIVPIRGENTTAEESIGVLFDEDSGLILVSIVATLLRVVCERH